jgi:hypothetical protein
MFPDLLHPIRAGLAAKIPVAHLAHERFAAFLRVPDLRRAVVR